MSNSYYTPRPVFDTLPEVIDQFKQYALAENPHRPIKHWLSTCFAGSKVSTPAFGPRDYQTVLTFLYNYRGSTDTFGAYRRELERLLQWSWFIREKSLLELKRDDIEAFIEFCKKPYKRWIGLKNVARFKVVEHQKQPNPEWRPFTVRVAKKDARDCIAPEKKDYQLSQQALKAMFGILSSFYTFLLQEELAPANPVALIRQKSKFIQQGDSTPTIRRLSNQQWQTVIDLARDQAKTDETAERTVFILSCLYSLYLRISELVADERWTPTMGDFSKDADGNWWFKTVSKGNKARQIAVSDAMLKALKTYRKASLNLPALPSPGEATPLIGHVRNPNRPMTSTRPIRHLVQTCFDQAADAIESQGNSHDVQSLRLATVHWLRHTGISEDVKVRPREHVRDDAGHSSSAITDRYIDVELKERARSAKKKPMAASDGA